jgi:hypothetical protein
MANNEQANRIYLQTLPIKVLSPIKKKNKHKLYN